jgi:hypothetical protein
MIALSFTSFAIGAGVVALVWSFWPASPPVQYMRGADAAKEFLRQNWDNKHAIEHCYDESFLFETGVYGKGYRDALLDRLNDIERAELTACKCCCA